MRKLLGLLLALLLLAPATDAVDVIIGPGGTPQGLVPNTRTVCGDPLTADVICTKADVGLSNVDNTSNAQERVATAVLENKQYVDRLSAITQTSGTVSPAPNADTFDIFYQYALTGTLTIPNPTATGSNPRHGQIITFIFKSATPQTLIWGSNYSNENGIPLVTTTTGDGNTYDQVQYRYNTVSAKWGMLAGSKDGRGVTALATSTTYTCPADTSRRCEMQMTSATNVGLTVAAPTSLGSPLFNGQVLILDFMCTLSNQTFTWNAIFIDSVGTTRPTTCPVNATRWTQVEVEYSTVLAKWQVMRTNLSGTGGTPPDAQSDGVTKGIASFVANDFICTSGNCGLNYGAMQKASASVPGALTAAAYTAFNKGTIHLPVIGAHQPTTGNPPAIIDRSGNHELLRFDAVTSECAWWNFRMNADYAGNLTAKIPYIMVSATSGALTFLVSVHAVAPGDTALNDTDSYDTANTCTTASVPAVAGRLGELSCALTANDATAAGKEIRLKVCRNTTVFTTGDAGITNEVTLEYTKQ